MMAEAAVSGPSVSLTVHGASLFGAVLVDATGDIGDSVVGPCAAPVVEASRVLIVPYDFPTIQAAIDAASYGDAVFVNAGVYSEHLRLRPGVRLLGAGALQTVLDGGGKSQNLIDFTSASNAVVRGFTLRNVGQGVGCARPDEVGLCSGNWYASAVYADGHAATTSDCAAPSLLFTQNIVTGNQIGMMLYFHARAVVTNNLFVGNRHALVANHHNDHAFVAQNVFYGNAVEAILADASFMDVLNNVIVNNGVGFEQQYSERGFVGCNVVFGNGAIGSGFGGGFIALDPNFLGPASGDFRLGTDSRAGTAGCFGTDLSQPTAAGAYGGPLANWFARTFQPALGR
jgi:hypothetical protein